MDRKMIKYNEGIIYKIKKFLSNLFKKKEIKKEEIKTADKEFKEEILIKQDEEEIKILNLQKKYKSGEIKEEDMTDEEHKRLIELYKKQNEELKEKIEAKRKHIRKVLDNM